MKIICERLLVQMLDILIRFVEYNELYKIIIVFFVYYNKKSVEIKGGVCYNPILWVHR